MSESPTAARPAAGSPGDPHRLVPADYFRQLRPGEIFPVPGRPLEVDLGCGDGSFLADRASAHPGRDFLGVERLLGRVRKVCRKARRRGLENLKVLRLESGYTVGWLLPSAAVARVHLLFPDPWPKKRHHRRRLVTPELVAGLHRVLAPGGEFLFKSDYGEYFDGACEVVDGCGLLGRLAWDDTADRPPAYPQTDFERQWLAEGRDVYRARWRKPPV